MRLRITPVLALVATVSTLAQAPLLSPEAERLATAVLDASSPDLRARLIGEAPDRVRQELPLAIIPVVERYRIAGELARALAASRLAVDLAEAGDPSVRSRTLNSLGTILNERGQYDEALAVLERSRDIARAAGDKAALADALLFIGTARFRKGNTADAIAAAAESLQLARELQNRDGIVSALATMGAVERQRGNFDRAIALYEEAIGVGQGSSGVPLARALNNLGVVQRERGDNDGAIASYRGAIEIYERLGYRAAAAGSRVNLGMSYEDQGLNDLAIDHFLKALAVLQEIGDRTNVAFALGSIGFLHRTQGDNALAVDYYRRSLAEYEAVGSRDGMARIALFLARVHMSGSDFAAAEPLFARALELRQAMGDRAGIANVVLDYGAMYERQGDLDRAVERVREGLRLLEEIRERRSLDFAYIRLAGLYNKRKDYREALEAATRGAEAAISAGQDARYWSAQLAAGRAWRGLGDDARAREAFNRAIESIEQLRGQVAGGEEERQRAFELRVDPYHEMVTLLADAGDARGALEYAERAKGRVLVDVLRNGRVNITPTMTDAEKQEEQRLVRAMLAASENVRRERQRAAQDAQRIASAERGAEEGQSRLDVFRAGLYDRHPGLQARRSESGPVATTDLRSVIPDARTAVVEYVVTRRATFALVVTRGADVEITLHRIDRASADLEQDVDRLRDALGRRDFGFRAQARTLGGHLFDPLKARLAGRSRLVIVPDGPLWELPFQALPVFDDRFLIQHYTVSTAPSLTALHAQHLAADRATRDARSIVAFGDPRADDASTLAGASPLPAAAAEANVLKRLYGANSRVFVGRDATERRFKTEARRSSILHVATHGILNNADPMASHLLLAPSNDSGVPEDGRLHAREILALTLDSELAILSGCDTARGRIGRGEGVIGLTWALFVAGVPTTVVSQWRVDSDSTAALIVEFHRQLSGGPRGASASAAEALRRSALTLLASNEYRHPFYWAGFVVVGDGLRALGPISRQ
jgi:CHAT domain-containing protein/tetratricopeptide (TPR) repeat protein